MSGDRPGSRRVSENERLFAGYLAELLGRLTTSVVGISA